MVLFLHATGLTQKEVTNLHQANHEQNHYGLASEETQQQQVVLHPSYQIAFLQSLDRWMLFTSSPALDFLYL